MFHQHPLTSLAGGASNSFSQGSSQPPPPVATELTCSLCQVMRHSLGLSVTGSLLLRVAVSLSHLLPFCPGDYRSHPLVAVLGRAPPVS